MQHKIANPYGSNPTAKINSWFVLWVKNVTTQLVLERRVNTQIWYDGKSTGFRRDDTDGKVMRFGLIDW